MPTLRHFLFALALSALLAPSVRAQSGLASRQPIGAFLNGSLPDRIPGTAYTAGDVFPLLRFKDPIKMVPRPGSAGELWVICQDGEVWSFDKSNPSGKTLVLDIKDICVGHGDGDGDSGLLGIAFHPQFGQSGSGNRGYIYLCYAYRQASAGYGPNSYFRLSRFTLPDGATQITRSSEQVLINQYDRKTWHQGGDIFFGGDGFLYISSGDEGDSIPGGGEESNSQKINDGLFSGVLRIDVDRDASRSHAIRRQPRSSAAPPSGWPATFTQNYFVPNDNPWLAADGSRLEEFWAIGFRSPHRMTMDPVTGKVLICDTGHDVMEEVDVVVKGANYEWAFKEGTAVGPITNRIGPGVQTAPIHTYSERTVDGSAALGGYVYRGTDHASDLDGKYVFGDFVSGNVWALDWQAATVTRRKLLTVPAGTGYRGLSGFGLDAQGEHYMMILGAQGRILKLESGGSGSQPPARLSATGAFASLASLTPSAGVIPYDVNSPLWSDGAIKQRWIALPNNGAPYDAGEVIDFAAAADWSFPAGTVLIKQFDLGTDDTNPAARIRLETRFFVRATNGWYGVTYRWRANGSDADLLSDGASQNVTITGAGGVTRTQRWDFPSRENCMTCHNNNATGVLGLKTHQLNGSITYPTGVTANQLATWSAIGMFNTTLSDTQIGGYPRSVKVTDTSATLETRMRSYVDANCSHCHRPEGVYRANSDMRFTTPLAQQGIVNGLLANDFNIAGMTEVTPGSISRTMMHLRLSTVNKNKMPPLGRNTVDQSAVSTLEQWIAELAGGSGSFLTGADVGTTGLAGSTTLNGATGVYTVKGAGQDIFGDADSFHFASQTMTGDGEIRARVTSLTNNYDYTKAGVMIRESLAPGSRHALIYTTPVQTGNGFEMISRAVTDGSSEALSGPGNNPAPNNWVRITRASSVLNTYTSADGTNWTRVGVVTLSGLPATVRVGLAVTSNTTTPELATATFDNVSITGSGGGGNSAPVWGASPVDRAAATATQAYTVATLAGAATDPNAGTTLTYAKVSGPAWLTVAASGALSGTPAAADVGVQTWTVRVSDGALTADATLRITVTAARTAAALVGGNIGPTNPAGATSFNSATGVYSVSSSGAGIAGTTDSFHFAKALLTGDGEIRARVTNLTSANAWAKAGVMIREDLSPGSRFGMAFVTTQNGFAGNYRTVAGGVRDFASGPASNTAPNNWVRVVRSGNVVTGHVSANGTVWTQIFTTSLSGLSSSVYFGLAVTATDGSTPASATFDNLQISGAAPAPNQAPVVTQPANQSTVRAVATSLQLEASDPEGTSLVYGASGLPAGLAINASTGLISGTVSVSAAATNSVTVTASDGALSTSRSFTWATTAQVALPQLAGADVGVVTIPGGTTFNNGSGVYTVASSGVGIAGTADAFQFASTTLTGDGEIRVRVTSLTNTNPWSKAGVMVREDASPGARFGMVFVTPQNGFGGNYRLAAGAPREYAGGPALNAPPNNWVRIVRVGTTLTGHASADGASWTQIFNIALSNLAATVRVGLAVTSTDNSQLATATFDNLQVTTAPLAPASGKTTNTLANLETTITQPAGYPSSWSQWLGTVEISVSNADGDLNADLMEFALGEDPKSGVTSGGLKWVRGEDGRHGARFRYPSRVADIAFEIETSRDLISWSAWIATPITTDDADAFRTVTYAALDGLLGTEGEATVFVRLRVTHRTSGAVATGEPLSLQRVGFAAGSQTLGPANVMPPVFSGRVLGVASGTLIVGAGITADPARLYYLEVRDGAFAGHRFDVAGFSANGVTVDLSSLRNTASALPDLTGASVVIREHVTLDGVLDKVMFIGGRSSSLADKVSIYQNGGYVSCWLFNLTTADPTKAIWVSASDATLANVGSRVVPPGEGLFVKSARNTAMIIGGNVRTNAFVQVLRPGQSFVAQPFPLAGSAAGGGFTAANGFFASRQKSGADQWLIWRADSAGGAASFSTLWYAQIGAAAYWTSGDNASLTDESAAVLCQPHRAVFLKRANGATTTALVPVPWSVR